MGAPPTVSWRGLSGRAGRPHGVSVLKSIARNVASLKRTDNETRTDHVARLGFEFKRRLRYLWRHLDPRSVRECRIERMVGPTGVWSALQQYQFDALMRHGLAPHHAVIDIGCGPLTVGLKLIEYLEPGRYVGLDLQHAPLAEAYRRIAKHRLAHKNPVLVNSATFGRDELAGRRFDYLWVSQLSYHLDDAQTADLLAQARAMMTPTAVLLMDVIDPARDVARNPHWKGFPYFVRPYAFFEQAAARAGLVAIRRRPIRDYGYPDKIDLSSNLLFEFRHAE